ncbi:MAG: adenylosuccinate lyase family protein [Candidatus Electrothrix communis]|nr:adenylosuccinate lyase family protein [Desulfobulbus sp. US4]WLE95728.1 MAG: adenylosuccinate lyase family protein [Candidatus Electrothrix communis]
MPAHPFDFQINPHVFSTPELEALFDEQAMLQRWLNFEAALATAQGKLGIIPAEAATEIQAQAKLEHIDLDSVREGYSKSRNSVVPLLGGLRRACRDGYGEYVHYGATTQDVLDTGQILSLQQILKILYRDLLALEEICLKLAEEHRATPMVARTHGQQALPTTFGLKVAGWLAEIRRHIERVKHLQATVCVGQLSGAVGTYAALGAQGLAVAEETMQLLGLNYDPLPWHTSRDRIAELASNFALLVMTLAKIANEIFQLQKTEIDELREPPLSGALSSSTMPHKQNPVICQRVNALAKHVRALAGTVMESSLHEHERDPRALWAEWLAIPQLCIYTGTALQSMIGVLSGLTVRTDQMLVNLHQRKDLISTEWLLFQLSKSMGKSKALEKLHGLAVSAAESGISLKEGVLADAEIGSLFTAADLAPLDRPEQYIGHAVEIVDRILADIRSQRQGDSE